MLFKLESPDVGRYPKVWPGMSTTSLLKLFSPKVSRRKTRSGQGFRNLPQGLSWELYYNFHVLKNLEEVTVHFSSLVNFAFFHLVYWFSFIRLVQNLISCWDNDAMCVFQLSLSSFISWYIFVWHYARRKIVHVPLLIQCFLLIRISKF